MKGGGGGVLRLDLECLTMFFVSKKLLGFHLVGSDEIIFQDKPPVKREFNLGSLSGCSFPSGFLEHRISFTQFGGRVSLGVVGVRGGWGGSIIGNHFADTIFLFLLVAL